MSLAEKARLHLQYAEQVYEARNPNSKRQHQAAARHLPGGNTRSVLHASPFPICMTRGKENRLYDTDGHEYLDFLGDMTAGLYGHSHPVIQETIISTMSKVGVNLGAPTDAESHFASALCERFRSIEQVRFCNSGTEANLYALSIARHATGKSKVIVFEGAYHGGVLSFGHGVASNTVDRDDWILGRYNDAAGMKRLISENKDVAAAVLVEPMQGAAGCIPGTAEFLHAVQDAAKESGLIFILDEVMTSRVAPGGLQSVVLHPTRGTPLCPDLTTLGKWIGGGMGIGAFGGRRDLLAVYDPRTSNIQHSGTFNNNTLAMNAGLRGLTEVYTSEACLQFNTLGDQLRQELQELGKGTRLVVTGVGSVMTIHFLSTGQKDITTVRDLKVEPGSVEEMLRDLFWFHLVEHGFWIARRGMASLVLGTTAGEVGLFLDAVREFLRRYKELLCI
ncbi:pyridoxal phosphate-dependent transferase [Aspergillus egyptiacus]|nr:pyridoxal phosphate-dependent transferase [Aspergillus egyptiacus]